MAGTKQNGGPGSTAPVLGEVGGRMWGAKLTVHQVCWSVCNWSFLARSGSGASSRPSSDWLSPAQKSCGWAAERSHWPTGFECVCVRVGEDSGGDASEMARGRSNKQLNFFFFFLVVNFWFYFFLSIQIYLPPSNQSDGSETQKPLISHESINKEESKCPLYVVGQGTGCR